jgi:hypothetical protein
MPWVARNECPGEACSLGTWAACSTLVVRREPRETAPVAFTLHRGDRFVAEAGDVHVTVPGMVVFRDTGTIKQSYEWSPPLPKERTYHFEPADTLYLLNYLAEGHYVWWLHGRADTGMFFWRSKNAWTRDTTARPLVVRESVEQWWVSIRDSLGRSGWVVHSSAIAGVYPHYDDTAERCAGRKSFSLPARVPEFGDPYLSEPDFAWWPHL